MGEVGNLREEIVKLQRSVYKMLFFNVVAVLSIFVYVFFIADTLKSWVLIDARNIVIEIIQDHIENHKDHIGDDKDHIGDDKDHIGDDKDHTKEHEND